MQKYVAASDIYGPIKVGSLTEFRRRLAASKEAGCYQPSVIRQTFLTASQIKIPRGFDHRGYG